jgi:hypothetical protein
MEISFSDRKESTEQEEAKKKVLRYSVQNSLHYDENKEALHFDGRRELCVHI